MIYSGPLGGVTAPYWKFFTLRVAPPAHCKAMRSMLLYYHYTTSLGGLWRDLGIQNGGCGSQNGGLWDQNRRFWDPKWKYATKDDRAWEGTSFLEPNKSHVGTNNPSKRINKAMHKSTSKHNEKGVEH